ncbi:unnamed protein product [Clonostachys rosea f. rosea IK726]|uniref:Cytochrome c oxidase assembly protein COX15 n=2 Tax=Bionectria ochroleuca TaxID=29856 RepID=A0A0B7K6Z2_BIOOC|nr:unnamed protein product [Clonostachys rosea f. rosea IK726]
MASPFSLGARRLASQLPSKFFVCNQCLLRQAPRTPASTILNVVRSRSISTETASATPLGKLAQEMSSRAAHSTTEKLASGKRFPNANPKGVGYWLIGSAVSVFGIVVWGGLTRLTESGLSITEWKPVTGSLPPMSLEDWESEFEKYRASPEFKLLNPHMNLEEFKKIYFMEWSHRVWGRFIGLSFVIPAAYLIARRRVTAKMAWNLTGISALIGFQGIIGWWMVKSGLKDDLFAPGSHPRVSQYRLTTHLGTAFICYAWMLVSGLSILRTRRFLADPKAAMDIIKGIQHPALKTLRRSAFGMTGLVFLTCMSGGLVAGLDAGLIYNEFPMMGLGLTPPKSELWDKFYCRKEDHSDLWWRNMLENPSLVQLDHRILATTTFCAALALFAYARSGRVKPALPNNIRKGTTGLVHLMIMQASLGICTLLWLVPINLAATHQAGSLAVLTGALILSHRMHVPRPTVQLIEQRLKQLAQK